MEPWHRNQLSFIDHLSQITSSQEGKLENCPIDREFEDFSNSKPNRFDALARPPPARPKSTGIFMVSVPDSVDSANQASEDEDAQFHTPPEHHQSSSEDQFVDELCAEALKAFEVGDGCSSRLRKARAVEEGGVNGEPERKKFRVPPEDPDTVGGEGETEKIEGNEDEDVHDTEVVVVDSEDYSEVVATVNLGDDVDVETRRDSCVDGSGGRRQLPASMRDVGSENDVETVAKRKAGLGNVDGSCRRHQFRASMKNVGGENEVQGKGGLMDYVSVLVAIFNHSNGGEDFLETAAGRGVAFPRPRWWEDVGK